MNDDEKSLHICLAMGLIELVKTDEEDTKPKGARAAKLKNLYDGLDKIIDMFRINSWPLEKQILAGVVLDKIELTVKRSFNPKLVGRCNKGRFIAREE